MILLGSGSTTRFYHTIYTYMGSNARALKTTKQRAMVGFLLVGLHNYFDSVP